VLAQKGRNEKEKPIKISPIGAKENEERKST